MVMKLRYLFLAVCLSTASLAQATSEAPSTKNKPLETASQANDVVFPDDFKAKLKSAKEGDVDAMVDVGLAYMDGTDFLQSNDQEAYRWFKKVSDLDNTDGDYYLGMLLQNQKKFKQAEYWYRRGAEKGDAYCQYAMGYLYEHGVGVEQNYQQAKAWYSEAAEQEHANAQFAMGLFYHDGLGGEVDYSKAREWYERSAVNNVAAAVNNLAVMYENGDGVEQDDDTAVYLYRQAANMGSAIAQVNMGDFYQEGHNSIEKNSYQAMYWYKRAAQQNNASAQLAIAKVYELGNGVTKDLAEAFTWYERAAQNKSFEAGMKVAEFYEKGLGGIQKNPVKAVELYQNLANQDYNAAQIKLAKLYLAGEWKEADVTQIANWLILAQGDSIEAKNQLAIFYLTGTGVAQNSLKARELLENAAFKKNSDAQNNLAVMYARGEGGEKNIFRAVMWFERAVELGNATAKHNLALLQQNKGVKAAMLKYTDSVKTKNKSTD